MKKLLFETALCICASVALGYFFAKLPIDIIPEKYRGPSLIDDSMTFTDTSTSQQAHRRKQDAK